MQCASRRSKRAHYMVEAYIKSKEYTQQHESLEFIMIKFINEENRNGSNKKVLTAVKNLLCVTK